MPTTNSNNVGNGSAPPSSTYASTARATATDPASTEVTDTSDGRPKRASDRFSLVFRAALFILACVFAVTGVMGFMGTSSSQATSRLVTSESIQGEPVRHACVVFSYDDADSNTAYERNGVLGVLQASGVSADVFYLDARSSGARTDSGAVSKTAAKSLTENIVEKAESSDGYDVVVAAGDDALRYVTENQELFAGIPISFFAVEDASFARSVQQAGVATGFLEKDTATLSLQAAANLLPEAKRVVVLIDGSAESQGLTQQLSDAPDVATGVARETWDTRTMTRDELATRLSSLGEGDVVLLLAAYADSEGKAYTPSATAYFLARSLPATVPAFSAVGGVGEGICGASFVDREEEGANAAKLAIELINGVSAGSRPIATVDPECNVFDVKALSAHGIDPNATPDDAALINEPTFSLRVLRPLLQPAILLLAAVLCIAGFGVIGFRRSVKSNRALVASRNDLQYRLYHDLLTELPNRYYLEQFAADHDASSKMAAMMQIDINDFTDINDTYGHAFGNEVIKEVARRLGDVNSLLLVRSGGDEFILAFEQALTSNSPEMRQITRLFNEPIVIGDSTLDISATVGVANREPGMVSESMIVYSDLATHDAKNNNKHVPVFYTDSLRRGMERKLEITSYLKRAIKTESFNVMWQPQVDTNTLAVYGYEALCRLEGNAYFPSDFIPVAEMSGLVGPIDRIVTKKVIAQLGEWIAEGREVGVASINFSPAQLRDKGYCDFVEAELKKHGVPASLIKIEITESTIIGNEEDADKLFSRLLSMGATLALDDFGTGYSSLHRMAKRPVEFVKLDKSLVDTFMVPGQEGFIGDITQLIHGLGKKIVVEGVETYEQYAMCRAFGCDYIQGYFFSRPVTAEEAISLDPESILEEARMAAGVKGRNSDWHKYDRDSRGRWKKKTD